MLKTDFLEIIRMGLAFRQRASVLRETFSSRGNVLFGIACAFLFGLAMYVPSRIEQIIVNMGALYGYLELFLLILVAALFGINIVLLIERVKMAQAASRRSIGITSIASLLGLLFSGCATCGLTLASYIGLGSFASLLPWGGNEVKLLSIVLLCYSVLVLTRPYTCEIKPIKVLKEANA